MVIIGTTFPIFLIVQNINYFELLPAFECNIKGQSETFICTEKDFCGVADVEYKVKPGPYSLDNWVERMGLLCRPSWQIGLIGAAYFTGWTLTTLWLPQRADVHGRIKYIQAAALINSLIMLVLMFSRSYWLTVGCLFAFGTLSPIRTSVRVVYLCEIIAPSKRTICFLLWSFFDNLAFIFVSVYLWKINKDWFPIILGGFAILVISTIGSLY